MARALAHRSADVGHGVPGAHEVYLLALEQREHGPIGARHLALEVVAAEGHRTVQHRAGARDDEPVLGLDRRGHAAGRLPLLARRCPAH